MSDGTTAPVIAGLAVGIAFVVFFSAMPTSLSTDSKLIASTMNLKEAQIFLSEYPSANVEVERTGNEVRGTAVKYSFTKIDYEKEFEATIRMFVVVDEITGKPTGNIYVECSASNLNTIGSRTIIPLPTVDTATFLKETECAK